MNPDPNDFLGSCSAIETTAPTIVELAQSLAGEDDLQTAKNCFLFVRDEIKHSSDFKMNPVTCNASDALQHRTGYCYAKSHLLCALLRANGIPSGLCYQRLSIDGTGPPFCLHGLNAIYFTEYGWYRVDARGNRDGIDAQFSPPTEQLAFPLSIDGEADLPEIHATPLEIVTQCLLSRTDWLDVYKNLPDTVDQ